MSKLGEMPRATDEWRGPAYQYQCLSCHRRYFSDYMGVHSCIPNCECGGAQHCIDPEPHCWTCGCRLYMRGVREACPKCARFGDKWRN